MGRVAIAARSSIWYGAVVRGDLNTVTIGRGTAVQDRAVVSTCKSVEGHVEALTVIGHNVVVGAARGVCRPTGAAAAPHPPSPPFPPAGPGALLQSCTIEDSVAIGAGAIVLEGALVERGARIGAGAVVHPGRRVPAGQLWEGNPAVFIRDLTKTELAEAEGAAAEVADAAAEHAAEFLPYTTAYNAAERLGVDKLDTSLRAINAAHAARMAEVGEAPAKAALK